MFRMFMLIFLILRHRAVQESPLTPTGRQPRRETAAAEGAQTPLFPCHYPLRQHTFFCVDFVGMCRMFRDGYQWGGWLRLHCALWRRRAYKERRGGNRAGMQASVEAQGINRAGMVEGGIQGYGSVVATGSFTLSEGPRRGSRFKKIPVIYFWSRRIS
jgi:hypothetical protein